MLLVRLHDGLYLRGHTLGVDHAALVAALQRRGVQTVRNVATRPDQAFADRWHAAGPANRYIHTPLRDSVAAVPAELVRRLAYDVVTDIRNGRGVLLHCDQGRNRSAFIAALALSMLTGEPGRAVVAKIRALRPAVLSNPRFESFLYEESCHRGDDQLVLFHRGEGDGNE